ncbi:MAG: hypothetical protein KKF46_05640 [Nanoarchaeota archaeon]|nr:hypothetical protein [Nanoarchaeota archaeon]MBU1321815.1 hypothetical protein [Nanoarchaeota archaeon]MBU1598262.1 hypothetical protein [Nanoarchaeota archaeon]MBU2441709.1 hypothetical protein [Nanoarchaeota archaeon]
MSENELVLENKPFYQRAADYLRKKGKALVTTPLIVGSLVAGSFFVKPPSLEAQVQQFMQGSQVAVTGAVVEKDDYINRDLDAVLEVTVVQDNEKTIEYNTPVRVLIYEDYVRGFNGNGEAIWDARSLLNSGDFIAQVVGKVYQSNSNDYELIVDPDIISFIDPNSTDGEPYATIDTNIDTKNLFANYKSMTTFHLYTQPMLWPFANSMWAMSDWDMDGIPNMYDPYPYSHDWGWGMRGFPLITWSPWGCPFGMWGLNPWYYNRGWHNSWAGWNSHNYYYNNYYDLSPDLRRGERPKFVITKKQLQAPRSAIGRFELNKGDLGSKVRTLDKGRLIRPTEGQIKKYGTSTRDAGTVRNIRKPSTITATRARTGTTSRGTVIKSSPPRTTQRSSPPPRTSSGTKSSGTSKVKKKDPVDYSLNRTYSSDSKISQYSGDKSTYKPTSTRDRAIIQDTIKRQQERIVPYQRTVPTPSRATTQKTTKNYQPKKYNPPTYQQRQSTSSQRTTTTRSTPRSTSSRSSSVSRAPTKSSTTSRSTVSRSTPTRSSSSRSTAARSSSSSKSSGSSSSKVKKK